jgi:hypothetical protein
MARQLTRWFVVPLGLLILVVAGPVAAEESDSWFDDPAPAPEPADRAAEPENTVAVPELPERPSAQPSGIDREDADPRALEEFKPALQPYGEWVEHPQYGLVWVPYPRVVGARFAPYVTSGHWALDESGNWVWVSDLPFGPIVFHYGRWVWVDDIGWAWIPGARYAHAWVHWRVSTGSYGYVGWAPAPPLFIWVDGYPVYYRYGYSVRYVFVPRGYVFVDHVDAHVVRSRTLARRILVQTERVPADPRIGTPRSPSLEQAGVPERRVQRRAAPLSGGRFSERSASQSAAAGVAPRLAPPRAAPIRSAAPAPNVGSQPRAAPIRPSVSSQPRAAPIRPSVSSQPRAAPIRPKVASRPLDSNYSPAQTVRPDVWRHPRQPALAPPPRMPSVHRVPAGPRPHSFPQPATTPRTRMRHRPR